MREVLARVDNALDEQTRQKLLLDAVVVMTADLSLDGVLAQIVTTAARLTDAEYAALGVLDERAGADPSKRLQTFVHQGMSAEQVAQIGDLPRGHGLLGLIIDLPEPLRLPDIAEHPASYGFPPEHPPMHSFLGVPIRSRNRVFGNLYLTEKAGGGDFTQHDQDVVVALAAAAGVAIENARLSEEATRRERWLTATAEITSLLAGSPSGSDALQAVADRAREVAGADVSWIVAGQDPSGLVLQVVSGVATDLAEMAAVHFEKSLAAHVVTSGEVMFIEDLAVDPRALDLASMLGWPRLGPVILVPLRSAAGIEGVLALAWTPANVDAYEAVDSALPARFAEHAALALQVTRAHEAQQRLALFEDRDRIGRDLHDLVIQRLFAVGLSLQGAARLDDRAQVQARLDVAVDDLDGTVRDIRRTIFALGSLEGSTDIQAEVTRMVDRAAHTLTFRPSLTFDGPVRTRIDALVAPDVVAVLGEALSNVARHAEASEVSVVLSVGSDITLVVVDDGRGLPDDLAESGVRNMRLRAEARGGRFDLRSSSGRTRLEWSVPVGGL